MAAQKKNTESMDASSAVELRHVPMIEAVGRQAVTTSMAVAEFFGKRHDNVMQAIRATIADCPEAFHLLNFQEVFREVSGNNGAARKMPCYLLTRDAFSLVAMGFTGKEAMSWKVAYIQAFNAMENRLRRPNKARLGTAAVTSPYVFEGTPVRARMIDGQPWVSALDMCKALGTSYASNMLKRDYHVRPEWQRIEAERGEGYMYRLKYVALPAVVQFCTRCKPERKAKRLSFLSWLVDDVFRKLAQLPSKAARKLTA